MSTALRHRGLWVPAAIIAVALLIGGLMVGIGGRAVSAQEDEGHPAHIHSGSCATLGEVVYPLDHVGGGTMMGTPVAAAPAGAATALPVDVSVTTVQVDLATLTGGEFAINVHESAENIGNYIACGDVGGAVMGSDLAFGLGELNDSGYGGTAWLHDNGDGTTTVVVLLLELEEEGAEAEESPEAAAGEVAVEIKDFAFSPDPLEIAVGTTVTWTNQDSAPHTATADGNAWTTERLDQGASGSVTFDTAGEFPYHCEFHPNMTGTIVVQ